MIYPPSLIPIQAWTPSIAVDGADFPVVRRVNGDFNQDSSNYIDLGQGVYHIKIDARDVIGLNELPDLSMNIISDDSAIENSYFYHNTLKDNEKNPIIWKGENVCLSDYGKVCHYTKPCYFLVFNSRNLHNITFPYSRTYPSELIMQQEQVDIDEKQLVNSTFNKNTVYSVKGKVRLRHNPTPLNYWHIVLDIHASSSNPPIKSSGSAWKKPVQNEVFSNILSKNIRINNIGEESHPLSRDKYVKAKSKLRIFYQKIIRYLHLMRFSPMKA